MKLFTLGAGGVSSSLAAGVAHEVNTPLAVISAYAQMLAAAPAIPALESALGLHSWRARSSAQVPPL